MTVSKTSRDALASVEHAMPDMKARVHAAIIASRDHGRTNEELRDELGMLLQSVCGCTNRLWSAGKITKAPFTRPGASGREAQVWVSVHVRIDAKGDDLASRWQRDGSQSIPTWHHRQHPELRITAQRLDRDRVNYYLWRGSRLLRCKTNNVEELRELAEEELKREVGDG